MPSKIVSALAAGALLVATSSALAQTASSSQTLPAVNSAALLQSGTGEGGASTALIIGGVLHSIGLLIWATGDDEAPEGVSP